MFVDAWAAAVVTGLLGTLPGRSLRFRVILVASVVTVSSMIATYVPELWIRLVFDRIGLPEGVTNGEWALLGLYLGVAVKTLVLAASIGLAFWIRLRLLPPDEEDSKNRKLLVLASIIFLLAITGGGIVASGLPRL